MKELSGKQHDGMKVMDWKELETRVVSTTRMYHVMDEEYPVEIWLKLESQYMSKSLTNKLLFKKKLYSLKMTEGSAMDKHINLFN